MESERKGKERKEREGKGEGREMEIAFRGSFRHCL